MEKRIKEIIRATGKKNYSVALSHINSAYNALYREKVNFSRLHAKKNFTQIANLDCPKVKNWHLVFYTLDSHCEKVIEIINSIAKKEENKFVNIENEDLVEKMMQVRNHCKLFAGERKTLG